MNRLRFFPINNKAIKVYLTLVTMVLFISRMAFPGLNYVFIPLFILALFMLVKDLKRLTKRNIFGLLRSLWQFILLGLLLCYGIVKSSEFLILSVKEALNFVIIFIFIIQLFLLSDSSISEYKTLVKIIIIFSVIIAVIGLFRFIIRFNLNVYHNIGSSIVSDNNFYSLMSILGILAICYNCIKGNTERCGISNLILGVLFLNVLFSFSRRGIFLMILLILLLFYLFVHNLITKETNSYFKRFKLFWWMVVSFIILIIFYLAITPNIRKQSSNMLGIKYAELKTFSNAIFYEYSTLFSNKIKYSDINDHYFHLEFNSNDPDTWGIGRYKVVYPLSGKSVEIVPKKAKGYLIDSTSNYLSWSNNVYSHTAFTNDSVQSGDIIDASVFCYVSPQFNGTWVRLSSSGSTFGENISYYDLNHTGEWQQLNIKAKCRQGRAPISLYLAKYGSTNFDSLRGYVIFAYPKYTIRKSDPKDPDTYGFRIHKTIPLEINSDYNIPVDTKGYLMDSTCNASTWNGNAYSYTIIGDDIVSDGDTIKSCVLCYVSSDFDGTWVRLSSEGTTNGKKASYYNLRKKGTWQKLSLNVGCDQGKAPVYLYFSKFGVTSFKKLEGYVVFAYPEYRKISYSAINKPDDKKITGNQNAELSTSIDSLNLDEKLSSFNHYKLAGPRLSRWFYAWYIFKDKYSMPEKILGGGFDYLTEFGYEFHNNRNRADYPHNPIISSFLYSGLVGGLFYIYFLVVTFIYYWEYRKYHMIFFLMYIVTFFFVFFSSDSHFDTPIFAFLSAIPFLTRYLVKSGRLKELVTDKK